MIGPSPLRIAPRRPDAPAPLTRTDGHHLAPPPLPARASSHPPAKPAVTPPAVPAARASTTHAPPPPLSRTLPSQPALQRRSIPPESSSATRVVAEAAPRSAPPTIRKSLPPVPVVPPAPRVPSMPASLPASEEELRAIVQSAVEDAIAPLAKSIEHMAETIENLQRCTALLALRPSSPPPPNVLPAAPHVAAPHVVAPHVVAPHVAAPHVAPSNDVDDAQLNLMRRRPKPGLYLAMLIVGLVGTMLVATALSHL